MRRFALLLAALVVLFDVAAHADGLTPAGPSGPATQGVCYASGNSGPIVPCVLRGQTWTQVMGPSDAADGLTVGGVAIPALLGGKAPLTNPVFPGSVTAQTYSGLASGMTAGPLGSTLSLTLSNLFAQLPVSVASFGAVGNGSVDDAPAINRAIQNRCARGGGRVLLMKLHRVDATIDNNCPRVMVEGYGFETAHENPTGAGTILVPTFAGDVLVHRTRPASEVGLTPDTQNIYTGGGFVDIAINGNCVATRLLHVTSVRGGTYRLTLSGAVGTEAVLFDTLQDKRGNNAAAVVGEASDIQGARIDLDVRQDNDLGNASCRTGPVNAVVMTNGTGNGNVSYNTDIRIRGRVYNGIGLVLQSADNNVFGVFGMAVLGSGRPFLIKNNTTSVVNDNNVFIHYGAGGNLDYPESKYGLIEGNGTVAGGTAALGTMIVNMDISNGTQEPKIGTGARLKILNGYPDWTNWSPTVSPETGSFTSTAAPEARYSRGTDATIRFTVSVSGSYSTAGGALRFTLPFPSRTTNVFSGYAFNTGRIMSCRTSAGSSVVNCLQFDGVSVLASGQSGAFYTITGTYESQ